MYVEAPSGTDASSPRTASSAALSSSNELAAAGLAGLIVPDSAFTKVMLGI
jgi:hypothetical protein